MTLERARQLIELACSTTHEEEARTAALAAARMIKKNGYEIAEAKPEPGPFDSFAPRQSRGPHTAYQNPFDFENIEDFMSFMRRARGPNKQDPRPRPPPGGKWLRLTRTSKPQRCCACPRDIQPGEKAYVLRDMNQVWCSDH